MKQDFPGIEGIPTQTLVDELLRREKTMEHFVNQDAGFVILVGGQVRQGRGPVSLLEVPR